MTYTGGVIHTELHMRYGIDLDSPELLDNRTWHWLRARIMWVWQQVGDSFGRMSDTRKAVPLGPRETGSDPAAGRGEGRS
jgi:hypothetical protein